LLGRSDQAVVAGAVTLLLLAVGWWWWLQGGWEGRLIDIDAAPPVKVEYLVDINTAGWSEIAQLPDLGETLARRIVDDRRQRGPFLDHDQLRRVRGIGPKTLEKMKPYLQPIAPAANTAGR
jgi:competence protein ComEA